MRAYQLDHRGDLLARVSPMTVVPHVKTLRSKAKALDTKHQDQDVTSGKEGENSKQTAVRSIPDPRSKANIATAGWSSVPHSETLPGPSRSLLRNASSCSPTPRTFYRNLSKHHDQKEQPTATTSWQKPGVRKQEQQARKPRREQRKKNIAVGEGWNEPFRQRSNELQLKPVQRSTQHRGDRSAIPTQLSHLDAELFVVLEPLPASRAKRERRYRKDDKR